MLSMSYEILVPIVATVVIGYLLGSISFSLVIGKVFEQIDVREHGSGNAGTTNALRVMGKKAAVAVLAGDILKCLVAVVAGKMLMPEFGMWIGGLACMLGHVFPVFFGFKGGKGVATGISMMVFVNPKAGFCALGVFLVVLLICRIVSVSSLSAFLTYPIFIFLFTGNLIYTLIATAMFIFVFFLHRQNIGRLLRGEEKKISFKSKKTKDVNEQKQESESNKNKMDVE